MTVRNKARPYDFERFRTDQTAEVLEAMGRLAGELSTAIKKLAFACSMQYTAPYYINVGEGDKGCGTCWDAERLAIT